MRLLIRLLVVSCFCVSFPALANTAFENMKVKKPDQSTQAPGFVLRGIDEQSINLADYKGKVVVLNFWATFCRPCRVEMPSLESLANTYRGADVVVLAISLDEDKDVAIKKLITKMGLTFPVALDGESAGDDYKVSVLPATFIIGKSGELLGRALGERDWASDKSKHLINTLLAEDS